LWDGWISILHWYVHCWYWVREYDWSYRPCASLSMAPAESIPRLSSQSSMRKRKNTPRKSIAAKGRLVSSSPRGWD
jgi:hypothetical protein